MFRAHPVAAKKKPAMRTFAHRQIAKSNTQSNAVLFQLKHHNLPGEPASQTKQGALNGFF
jgi:hypothetical protein